MEYETLYLNDNGTIKVRMTIEGRVLEQDFDADKLDENVKQGMAVFKTEIDNIPPPPSFKPQTVIVTQLPPIDDSVN